LDGETPESVADLEARRRRELRKASEQKEAAQNLVAYLEACNVEALVGVARNSLDALRQRISVTAADSGRFYSSKKQFGNKFLYDKTKKNRKHSWLQVSCLK